MTNKKQKNTKQEKKLTFHEKLLQIQKEAKVKPSGENTHHGYKYTTIEDVVNATKPLFTKYNLLILPKSSEETKDGNRHTVKMTWEIKDLDSNDTAEFTFTGQGDDKQGSAVGLPIAYTMARKEFLIMVTQLATGEDAEADAHSQPDENKIEKIIKQIGMLKTKKQVESALQKFEEKQEDYDTEEQTIIMAAFEAKLKEFEEEDNNNEDENA